MRKAVLEGWNFNVQKKIMWQSLGWAIEYAVHDRTVAASATGAVTAGHWTAPVAEAATVRFYPNLHPRLCHIIQKNG